MIFPGLEEVEVLTDILEKKESRCLAKGMSAYDDRSVQGLTKERQITEILMGTKKTRFGSRLTDENEEFARDVVKRYMDVHQPIHFVTLWGPVKGYEPGLYECPDIGDILALRRYAILNKQVGSVYEPGISVTIHPEDSGKIARFSHLGEDRVTTLRNSMKQYDVEMRELIDALGMAFVSWVPESEVFASMGIGQETFNAVVDANFRLLHRYWEASEGVDEAIWRELPEYRALEEMGWRGTIPYTQRDCYLQRAANHGSQEDGRFNACMYLSAAFARHQLKLIQPKVSDNKGPIPVLKATFVPLPKGAPEQLKRGRFDYKPRDTCGNYSETPWSFGGVRPSDGYEAQPFLMSTRQAFTLSQGNVLRPSRALLYGVNATKRINCYKALIG